MHIMVNMYYKIIASILPLHEIFAHCDVPCGIYDPKAAQTAAATVLKMTQKLIDEKLPNVQDKGAMVSYQNAMTRYVITKEEHARKCKEELLILWTDYFKPEHIIKFPELHNNFWMAAKLCSSTKQEVSIEHAGELVAAVDGIAEMFTASKKE